MPIYENSAGGIEIYVAQPSPRWTKIKYKNVNLPQLNEKGIENLYYLVKEARRAIRKSQKQLGE